MIMPLGEQVQPPPSPDYPNDWCEYHQRVEPVTDETYRICGECWHAFTKEELITLSRELGNFRHISKTFVCPLCAHDF